MAWNEARVAPDKAPDILREVTALAWPAGKLPPRSDLFYGLQRHFASLKAT
jgi:hypothetical protein